MRCLGVFNLCLFLLLGPVSPTKDQHTFFLLLRGQRSVVKLEHVGSWRRPLDRKALSFNRAGPTTGNYCRLSVQTHKVASGLKFLKAFRQVTLQLVSTTWGSEVPRGSSDHGPTGSSRTSFLFVC